MVVTTLAHGKAVVSRLLGRMPEGKRWLALDTETEAKPGFGKNDALVINRARIVVWSACYRGESYSFPTSFLSAEFPTILEWIEAVLQPLFDNDSVVKVYHNFNYDANVQIDAGLKRTLKAKFWDTMLGAWKSCASREKGLKSRAPLYGRLLRKTKSVKFTDLAQLTSYAEEDVVATDELYQMQIFGLVVRPPSIAWLKPNGSLEIRQNPMPVLKLQIPDEDLDEQERLELELQEIPYLRSTIRAERRGIPFNVQKLREKRRQCQVDRDVMLKKILRTAGRDINLNAPAQIAKLFTDLGINITSRTAKGAPSVNARSLIKMRDSHPIVNLIEQYRANTKLQSVYLGQVGGMGEDLGLEYFVDNKGLVHPTSNTCGAVTGRGSCSSPNFQQLPSRKDAYKVKECVCVD